MGINTYQINNMVYICILIINLLMYTKLFNLYLICI